MGPVSEAAGGTICSCPIPIFRFRGDSLIYVKAKGKKRMDEFK